MKTKYSNDFIFLFLFFFLFKGGVLFAPSILSATQTKSRFSPKIIITWLRMRLAPVWFPVNLNTKEDIQCF